MKSSTPLLLLIIALFIGCSVENPLGTEELRGTISGIVSDTTGAPISGVDIATDGDGYNGVTDSKGKYTIPDVKPGTYSLSFTHSQYIDGSVEDITIARLEEIVEVDKVLKRKQYISFVGSMTGPQYFGDDPTAFADIFAVVSNNTTPVQDTFSIAFASSAGDQVVRFSGTVLEPSEGTKFTLEIIGLAKNATNSYPQGATVIYDKTSFSPGLSLINFYGNVAYEGALPKIFYYREISGNRNVGDTLVFTVGYSDTNGYVTEVEWQKRDDHTALNSDYTIISTHKPDSLSKIDTLKYIPTEAGILELQAKLTDNEGCQSSKRNYSGALEITESSEITIPPNE